MSLEQKQLLQERAEQRLKKILLVFLLRETKQEGQYNKISETHFSEEKQ